MLNRKSLLGLAFAGLAAVSLFTGYSAQKKTSVPVSSTAYSHSPVSGGTVRGSVGTPSTGLDYVVNNLTSPKVGVLANVEKDSFAYAEHDTSTKTTSFYARKELGKNETISGTADFSKGKEETKIKYEQARAGWLKNIAFSYTESIGKTKDSYIDADFKFNLFGRPRTLTLRYTI